MKVIALLALVASLAQFGLAIPAATSVKSGQSMSTTASGRNAQAGGVAKAGGSIGSVDTSSDRGSSDSNSGDVEDTDDDSDFDSGDAIDDNTGVNSTAPFDKMSWAAEMRETDPVAFANTHLTCLRMSKEVEARDPMCNVVEDAAAQKPNDPWSKYVQNLTELATEADGMLRAHREHSEKMVQAADEES